MEVAVSQTTYPSCRRTSSGRWPSGGCAHAKSVLPSPRDALGPRRVHHVDAPWCPQRLSVFVPPVGELPGCAPQSALAWTHVTERICDSGLHAVQEFQYRPRALLGDAQWCTFSSHNYERRRRVGTIVILR